MSYTFLLQRGISAVTVIHKWYNVAKTDLFYAFMDMHYPVCTKATLRRLYFLFVWMDFSPRLIFKPSPHVYGLGLPRGLPFELHSMAISLQSPHERVMFVFPSGFELFAEGLMYWIKSLSAQSYPDRWLPSNPASQKTISQAFVQTLKGTYVSIPNGCKSVAVTRCTCCWLSCWLITWRPSHLTPYYEL